MVNILRNKPLIITIVILVILILLMAMSASSGTVAKSASAAGSAFVPLQSFFYRISDSISGFFSGSENYEDENTALRAELSGYKTQLKDYNELVAENERLSAMLDYKNNNPKQELRVASIIGKEPGNWFDIFTINLGAKDGIKENMPVITPDGLVGRVEQVGINWSKVMGIIDGRSRVSAIMERTRDVVVAGGSVGLSSDSAILNIDVLPLDSDIVEGDVVVTSGLDSVYPKGIVIGDVTGVTSGSSSVDVKVKPAVDFRRLEEVMVVLGADETAAMVTDNIADVNAVADPAPSASSVAE